MSSEKRESTPTGHGYPDLSRQERFDRANEMMGHCRDSLEQIWRKILNNPLSMELVDESNDVRNQYLNAFAEKCDQEIKDLEKQTLEGKVGLLMDTVVQETKLRTFSESAAMTWRPLRERIGETVICLLRRGASPSQEPHLATGYDEDKLRHLCRLHLHDVGEGLELSNVELVGAAVSFTSGLITKEYQILDQEYGRRHD